MRTIDTIITESIYETLNEKAKKPKKLKSRNGSKVKSKRMKTRKMAYGGTSKYDYDEYLKANRPVAPGDADEIISRIDTERTNIADVARDVFPDHTEEGAQSQLRKILKKERPMTKKVYNKLSKFMSSNEVAMSR